MKMAFEIKLSWVEDKIPLLKEVDIKKMSGGISKSLTGDCEENKN